MISEVHSNVLRRLNDLQPHIAILVLLEALDLMEQYNGRTKNHCLVEAMGGIIEEQDNGAYRYKLPDILTVEKKFS